MSGEDWWMLCDLIGLRQWMANGSGGAARRRHGSESAATTLTVAQRSSGGSNCSATTVAMTLTGGGRRTESWSASAQDGEGTIERAAGSLCARKCGCCGCGLRFAS